MLNFATLLAVLKCESFSFTETMLRKDGQYLKFFLASVCTCFIMVTYILRNVFISTWEQREDTYSK